MLRLTFVFSMLLIGACTQHTAGNAADQPASLELTGLEAAGSKPVLQMSESMVMTVIVGPQRVDCVGVGAMTCLLVDGAFFYDEIEGFNYQEGNLYTLKIERSDAFADGLVPADASQYAYRLIEIISKTAQD